MNKTAIVIVNYNMIERCDALVEHIHKTVHHPHDLFVVDNGSDLVAPSKYSTLLLPKNVQTTNGFLKGLEIADSTGLDYFAYWMIITSSSFIEEDLRDPLQELMPILVADKEAFAVQPAIEFGYEQAWSEMMSPRDGKSLRRAWGTDYISTLFRAKHFNAIGRYRPELTMMWGVPGECNWKARKKGLHIFIHDGYVMRKDTDIGYTMDRMNMTKEERRNLASAESDRILEPIYGKDYRDRFGFEYRETSRGEY
jgi:hypothetical protein